MVRVSVSDAKARLSELLRRVAAGQEVTITKAGKPIARLVPVAWQGSRQLGRDQGLFQVPDDFDAPLSEETLRDFGG